MISIIFPTYTGRYYSIMIICLSDTLKSKNPKVKKAIKNQMTRVLVTYTTVHTLSIIYNAMNTIQNYRYYKYFRNIEEYFQP